MIYCFDYTRSTRNSVIRDRSWNTSLCQRVKPENFWQKQKINFWFLDMPAIGSHRPNLLWGLDQYEFTHIRPSNWPSTSNKIWWNTTSFILLGTSKITKTSMNMIHMLWAIIVEQLKASTVEGFNLKQALARLASHSLTWYNLYCSPLI